MNQKDIKKLQKASQDMAMLIRKMAPAIIDNVKKADPEMLKDLDIDSMDVNLNEHVANMNKEIGSLDEKIKKINGNIHR